MGVSCTEDKENEMTWEEKFDLLKGLLKAKGEYYGLTEKQIRKIQIQFEEQGHIPQRLILKVEAQDKPVQIGKWLNNQRQMLNQYRELILQNRIDEIEDERARKLARLGVSCTEENEMTWEEKFELLKGLLKAEGEYYGLTEEQVRKIQRQFEEQGYIPYTLILKVEAQDKPVQIGRWLYDQRQMLNQYRELISQNKIEEIEDERARKLASLGVSCTEKNEMKWEEKFNLLKGLLEATGEYYGLTEIEVRKLQSQFKEKGFIPHRLKLKIEGKDSSIQIGSWLGTQRNMLNKYRNLITFHKVNEIEDEEERRKVECLLDLKVSCTQEKDQENEMTWEEKLNLFKGLLEAKGEYYRLTEEQVRKIQIQFEEQGYIPYRLILKVKGQDKPVQIGIWLSKQRQMLNKYRELISQNKIKEIEDVEERRRVGILLDLGVSCTEEKDKENEMTWEEKFELLKGLLKATGEYYGLTADEVEKAKSQFEEQGYITSRLILKVEAQDKPVQIGMWLSKQRQMLNQYRELILQKKFDEIEDERARKLASLGVSCTEEKDKESEMTWEEKFKLLKGLLEATGEYYGLTEDQVRKIQRQFEEKGFIPQSIQLKIEGQDKPVQIGMWLSDQRKMLNKYRELILQNRIDEIEDERARNLARLGVSCTEEKDKENELTWEEKLELLKGLLEATGEYYGLTEEQVRKVQKQFNEKGYIPQKLILKIEGKDSSIQIGSWLGTQRNMLNKYRELILQNKIDKIEDERARILASLGVSCTGEKGEKLKEAKRKRDQAEKQHAEAVALEDMVEKELKKRGQGYGEQQ